MAAHLCTEREGLDRRQAEGDLTAEEFDAWLQDVRDWLARIRQCDVDIAAEMERAAKLESAAA